MSKIIIKYSTLFFSILIITFISIFTYHKIKGPVPIKAQVLELEILKEGYDLNHDYRIYHIKIRYIQIETKFGSKAKEHTAFVSGRFAYDLEVGDIMFLDKDGRTILFQ